MNPSLPQLIEDYFKPKWWQFFRKQKYHVCQNYGSVNIYEVPDVCIVSEKLHNAKIVGHIFDGMIDLNCNDECPPIKASDPDFFKKLDEYSSRKCYYDDRRLKMEKVFAATTVSVGPQGPPGPMGPAGPAGGGLVI